MGGNELIKSFHRPLGQITKNIPLDLPHFPERCKPIKNPSLSPPIPQSILKYIEKGSYFYDKLATTYNPLLPQPKHIDNEDPSVIVLRGCRADQLAKMLLHSSAGGITPDRKTLPPSEEAVKLQVGEKDSLPEFTFNPTVANRFGKGCFIVACEIKTKYLSLGSTAEQGVVCSPKAPIKFLAWKFGPLFKP